MFNAPIPGESLTVEPGNAPWEQPPQFAKVDEALTFYMDKFEDDELFEDLLFILDNDMPIDLFLDTMLLYGEMEGRHTSDVSLLIGPVLHEHIKSVAEAAGIKYREFQGEGQEEKTKGKQIADLQMSLNLTPEEVMEEDEEVGSLMEEIFETPPVEEKPSRGLMQRRT
jgi:hypothetical protein